MVSIVYMCQSQSPNSFYLSHSPWYLYVCSLPLCFSLCLVNKIVATNSLRSHIYASLSGWWISLSWGCSKAVRQSCRRLKAGHRLGNPLPGWLSHMAVEGDQVLCWLLAEVLWFAHHMNLSSALHEYPHNRAAGFPQGVEKQETGVTGVILGTGYHRRQTLWDLAFLRV